jgi:NADH dehydrogenase
VARALGRAKMPVTLIDRQNYHLFQPLLYQVATAALSPADIAEPIRKILRRYRSAQVMLGEVEHIDREAREVVLREGQRVPYDILVLATGATHSYFGHPEWERSAPGLKTIADARLIRSEILRCFEKAEITDDVAERERLMTFAVVGGGPTGVEMAGAIAELARYVLAKDFRNIRPERANVILIEAGPRLLTAFPESLASDAEKRLKRLGVTVMLNSPVTPLSQEAIHIDGRTLPVAQRSGQRVLQPLRPPNGSASRRTRPDAFALRPISRYRVCRTPSRSATSRSRSMSTASPYPAWRRSPIRKASILAKRSRAGSHDRFRRSGITRAATRPS